MKLDHWSEPGVIVVRREDGFVLFRIVDDMDAQLNAKRIIEDAGDEKLHNLLEDLDDFICEVEDVAGDVDTDSINALSSLADDVSSVCQRADELKSRISDFIK